MKISFIAQLFTALIAPLFAASHESHEETVGNWSIQVCHTEDVLDDIPNPPVSLPEVGDLPAHLQYIIGLDQTGIVDMTEGVGMPTGGDPEYAITLSSGEWKFQKHFWGKPTLTQTINRCRGGGWTFFNVDSSTTHFYDKKFVDKSGKEFFELINADDDKCNLYFAWNEDATEARITGYFDNFFAATAIDLSIKLQPYWKWKFGLKTSNKEGKEAKELDAKCCPPKDDGSSCLGEATLGKAGTPCDTISMACGEIHKDNVSECAFYRRNNKMLGLVLASYYHAYPLADKNGEPTSYNTHFVDTYTSKGVTDIFHPLTESGTDGESTGKVEAEL